MWIFIILFYPLCQTDEIDKRTERERVRERNMSGENIRYLSLAKLASVTQVLSLLLFLNFTPRHMCTICLWGWLYLKKLV